MATTYLGPYIECKTQNIEIEEEFRCCTNTNCESHLKQVYDSQKRFCEKCGMPIGKATTKKIRRELDVYKIMEEIKEALFCLNADNSDVFKDRLIDIWINNWAKGEPEGREFAPMENCLFEVSQQMIENDLKHFKKVYVQTLELLEQKYGKDNIIVKWGYIRYFFT